MNKLKEMDGQEIWTEAFGERDCVGVSFPFVYCDGEKIKPTTKQINQLWDDLMYQEFGTPAEFEAMVREEFG